MTTINHTYNTQARFVFAIVEAARTGMQSWKTGSQANADEKVLGLFVFGVPIVCQMIRQSALRANIEHKRKNGGSSRIVFYKENFY